MGLTPNPPFRRRLSLADPPSENNTHTDPSVPFSPHPAASHRGTALPGSHSPTAPPDVFAFYPRLLPPRLPVCAQAAAQPRHGRSLKPHRLPPARGNPSGAAKRSFPLSLPLRGPSSPQAHPGDAESPPTGSTSKTARPAAGPAAASASTGGATAARRSFSPARARAALTPLTARPWQLPVRSADRRHAPPRLLRGDFPSSALPLRPGCCGAPA